MQVAKLFLSVLGCYAEKFTCKSLTITLFLISNAYMCFKMLRYVKLTIGCFNQLNRLVGDVKTAIRQTEEITHLDDGGATQSAATKT